MVVWIVSINIIAVSVFIYDKQAACSRKRRIPELWLHLFELMGGVFGMIPMMYCIRHKNRKFAYYSVSWIIMIGWIILELKMFRII
jgi:uncharacterized membrane protein YsdA (DUF1294 family)